MKQYLRKADIILFIALVVVGLAVTVALSSSRSAGETVVIRSGGELYAAYPLSEDREIVVPAPDSSPDPGGYNTVVISGGTVSVTEASCLNQVCVRAGSISRSGESIVCLPNRLIVRIEGGKGGSYDSVTS